MWYRESESACLLQVTVPLSHLINVLHSVQSSVGGCSTTSSSRRHKELLPQSQPSHTQVFHISTIAVFIGPFEHEIIVITCFVQPKLNLRELGLSDLGQEQLDELVKHVFPCWSPQDTPFTLGAEAVWRTSHMSTHSFFCNKHGETDLCCCSFLCKVIQRQ